MEQTERNYGRKIIRDGRGIRQTKKSNKYVKQFILLIAIAFLIGAVLGSIFQYIIVQNADMKKMNKITISASETEIITNELYASGNNSVKVTSFEWKKDDAFIPLDVPMDEDLQQFVFYISKANNIDWTLVMAMINHESSFKADAISKTHDYGMMQINQGNHEWLSKTLGVTDFLDAQQNIRCGIYILHQLFEKHDNTHLVLMSYNMGEGAASRLWSGGVHSTPYSERITQTQAEYQQYLQERMEENNGN